MQISGVFHRFFQHIIIFINQTMSVQRLTLLRLQKEEVSLENQPLDGVIVTREDLLNFHFLLYGLEGPYLGGYYHGKLQMHQNYPFMAPKLFFYTPNGRFEVNIPICTSFTNYHQQSWTSAWNIRTLILATISFMYSEQESYGCKRESDQARRQYAKRSLNQNCKMTLFNQLFLQKLYKLNKVGEELYNQINSRSNKIESSFNGQIELGLLTPNLVRRNRRYKLIFWIIFAIVIIAVICFLLF